MLKSSKVIAFFSACLILLGSVTALHSNDLGLVKIYTYKMKPIFSYGDRQPETENSMTEHSYKKTNSHKIVQIIQRAEQKKIAEQQSFSATPRKTFYHASSSQSDHRSYGYRVASHAPINIIPDHAQPTQFARSYAPMVVGKKMTQTAMRGSDAYRATVRHNGPVMLRPVVTQDEATRRITNGARLPISSAKDYVAPQTAMR